MKVKELKKLLDSVDEDKIIILQKDGEGNGYSPLSNIDSNCVYEADSTYSGNVGIEFLTPELRKQGYSEEDMLVGESALVLYPIN